jgi:hypothetical protein
MVTLLHVKYGIETYFSTKKLAQQILTLAEWHVQIKHEF